MMSMRTHAILGLCLTLGLLTQAAPLYNNFTVTASVPDPDAGWEAGNGQRRRQLGEPDGCVKYELVKSPQCHHCNHNGCSKGGCSAFTRWSSCSSLGKGWVDCGWEKCTGGFCSKKRWCGMKCDSPTETTVGIDQVTYETNPGKWSIKPDVTTASATASYDGENQGPTEQVTGSIIFSVTEEQSASLSFKSTTKVSTEFSAGIPIISGGGLTVTAEQSIAVGKDYTNKKTVSTKADAGGLTLAPRSRQQLQFSFQMQQYQIPFTARMKVKNSCGIESYKSVDGVANVKGVANTASGSGKWEFGPVIPWNCKSPFGVPFDQQATYEFCPKDPSDQCTLNVMCNADAIGTDCGCTGDNPHPCCSTARAHPKCASYSPNAVLCPDFHGNFDPCC